MAFSGIEDSENELIFDGAIRKSKGELGLQLRALESISVEESIFDENDGINVHTINFVVKIRKLYNSQNIVLDHTHSEFAWFDKVSSKLHQCVKRPC